MRLPISTGGAGAPTTTDAAGGSATPVVIKDSAGGVSSTIMMSAIGDTTGQDYSAPPEILEGLTANKIVINSSVAIGDNDAILVGASTTDSQGATIGGVLDLLAAAFLAPPADQAEYPDTLVITQYSTLKERTFEWDGTTTIKSIAMRYVETGATTANAVSVAVTIREQV